MSRMFPWERWPTILIGYLYACMLLLDQGMGRMRSVPSTCGDEFFLPPLQRAGSEVPVVGWLEAVPCRDPDSGPVTVTLTIYTASGDVVYTLSVVSNHTLKVEYTTLARCDGSTGKRGCRLTTSEEVSVYVHSSSDRTDVMVLLPFRALSTNYLVPDLRTSSLEEQRVVFHSIHARTNVTVKTITVPKGDRNFWPRDGGTETGSNDTKTNEINTGDGVHNDRNNNSVGDITLAKGTDSVSPASTRASTTAVKATPKSVSKDNNSDETATSTNVTDNYNSKNNNSNSNNTNNNNRLQPYNHLHGDSANGSDVSTSIYFLSDALQTRTVYSQPGAVLLLRADKSLGVTVVLLSASSSPTSASSLSTSSASSADGKAAAARGCGNNGCGLKQRVDGRDNGEDGEEMRSWMTMEMLPPSSSFGKHFYLPLMNGFSRVKLLVTGKANATLAVSWTLDNSPNTSHHYLLPFQSLVLELSIKHVLPNSHLWMASTSPLLVYVVIETGAPQEDRRSECLINGFVLPPIEQYFRCVTRKVDNSCHVVCPSFGNSLACRRGEVDPTAKSVKVEIAVPSSNSSSNTSHQRHWHVQHVISRTSLNTTEACVTANGSFLHFNFDPVSGSLLPLGTRLRKLYRACLPNGTCSGNRADKDDPDYKIKNKSDDNAVVEDTSSNCEEKVASRISRSRGDLQKAVADPVLAWPFVDYEEEESEMPLFAVIISLSVAIFAVIAVISIFLLMELMSRRRQIRNTKIRPFVS